MTDPNEDPVLLLAEAVVASVEAQRAFAEQALVEMRAMVAAVRAMPAPVVNVAAAEVTVPAPVIENRIEQPAPAAARVQDIRIVGLPRLNATARKNRDGSTTISEE
jgi:hypothetical protein